MRKHTHNDIEDFVYQDRFVLLFIICTWASHMNTALGSYSAPLRILIYTHYDV
jgi:hypothetical protein